MTDTSNPALHPNETIKAHSRGLRGGISEGLRRQETGALADDDTQLPSSMGSISRTTATCVPNAAGR